MSLVRDLVKDYGDFKVEIPSWEISDSGITALLGPSGSGKTSVFRLLIGIESCESLTWEFQGEDLAKFDIGQRNLGVVFQNYEIFPHMTAEQNIAFALEAKNISKDTEKVQGLIAKLGLESCKDTLGAKLSGGEQQRTAIARALVANPRFLLLDEPFSSLDADLRKSARELVKSIISEHKIPTLLVTHDKEDVDALADHKVHIQNGSLQL